MHQGVRPDEKVVVLSIHGYVSIYRRTATQPLALRWGFETTSNLTTECFRRKEIVPLFFCSVLLTFFAFILKIAAP